MRFNISRIIKGIIAGFIGTIVLTMLVIAQLTLEFNQAFDEATLMAEEPCKQWCTGGELGSHDQRSV